MTKAGRRERIGLVLSGGGARGFAHIGVLRALERAGIEADVVAGTSIGAILGALYCSGYRADDLYALAERLTWRDVIDVSLKAGLIKGQKLHQFLAAHLPPTFEELQKPLVVTTTDVETGAEVFLLKGDLITAVRASSCFPGAFEPVQVSGQTLADGGIVNNLPVEATAVLHASYTIASDVTPPRRAAVLTTTRQGNWWERMVATVRLERRNPMVQMLLRSSDIMQSILTDIQYTMHPAELRIQPRMPHIRLESFMAFREIVALGEREATRVLEQAELLPMSSSRPPRKVSTTSPRAPRSGT